ncbi:MAG: glycosyltransferase [Patescibacteria group bacterium]
MNNKYILATHVWSDGPSQALREYLIKNKQDFVWINHPLFYSKKIAGSGYSIFVKGQEIKKRYFSSWKLWEPIKYIVEIFLNIIFIFSVSNTNDYVYIGYNNLNALSGIFLKKTGKVKKVIYYVIDYTPRRFENRLLNYIFHKVDQFCVKYADETWNLNEKAMNNARKKFYNFDAYKKGYSVQKEVPMGFWKDRIKLKNFNEINKKQIVFMGHLIEKQGVQFVIKSLPEVIKVIPEVKLVIVGSGSYLENLKKIVKDLSLEKVIEFKGYVEELEKIEIILCDSALAVAIYEEGNPETNFTYYTDQGKIKNYLGCGLLILLSNVPSIAKEIERNKCGFIIDNNPCNISSKIIEILDDENKLRFYRDNVIKYRNKFDWNLIFEGI